MADIKITRVTDLSVIYLGIVNCLDDNANWVYFSEQLKSGDCQAFEINDGESYTITRVEKDRFDRMILVICCFEGKNVADFADYITRWARLKGFDHIRFHTKRKGLEKLVKNVCPENTETIYKVEL